MDERRHLGALRDALLARRRTEAWLYAIAAGVLTALWWRAASGAWSLSAWLCGLAVCAAVAAALLAWCRSRAVCVEGVARRMDAAHASLEDGTALLLAPVRDLAPLARLQHARVARQFGELAAAGALARAMPAFPTRRAGSVLATMTAVGLAGTWWLAREALTLAPAGAAGTAATRIEKVEISLQPPAYMKRAASRQSVLDIDTVEGAGIVWRIDVSRDVQDLTVALHDGETLALARDAGGHWVSPVWPARGTVYRLLADGREVHQSIGRVAAEADLAPAIDVTLPGVSVRRLAATAGEDATRLRLSFTANDDYGITEARARVTLARGSGEQVRFRERAVPLEVERAQDGRRIAVTHDFDLRALGMAPGDEFFVFAEVLDNRAGRANVGVSPTYIVRWLGEEQREEALLEAMALDVLPEYFRSQRQIIIDTEALIEAQPRLDEDTVAQRAQSLAADQRLLRLRYGAFLGEEADSGIGPAVPAGPVDDNDKRDEHEDHEDHEDHGQSAPADAPPASGDAQAAIELYAHFHDRAEQATLFEPQTRDLLKKALAAMWDAELPLRLGDPQTALTPEYNALEYIKQVQQSSRIYLRRVGFRPTPVDEERRLSGELDEIPKRRLVAGDQQTGDFARLRSFVGRLADDDASLGDSAAALEPVIARLAVTDSEWLEALSALQRLRRDAGCAACRRDLGRVLWRKLPPPLAAPRKSPHRPTPLARAVEATS